eukprot:6172993-Pleurochrysis_carterae.AAC.1
MLTASRHLAGEWHGSAYPEHGIYTYANGDSYGGSWQQARRTRRLLLGCKLCARSAAFAFASHASLLHLRASACDCQSLRLRGCACACACVRAC